MRSLRWRAIGEVGPEVALTPDQAAVACGVAQP